MRKPLYILIGCCLSQSVFAEPFVPVPSLRIFAPASVVEYAISKYISVMYQDAVKQEYEKRMDQNDGSISTQDLMQVCNVAKLNQAQCTDFQKALMIRFYDVCGDGKGKSGDCIKDFYSTLYGTSVRVSEALRLAQEYALIKKNHNVVCNNTSRSEYLPKADFIKCTSVDGKNFYEFKFNSVSETGDKDIIISTLRGVGKIHNIEFVNSGCSLERIHSDSNCALSYKTTDTTQCEKINKTLTTRFGYSAKIVNTEKFGKRCEVFGISGKNRTAYGIDNAIFKEVQYQYGPDLEKYIKEFVKLHLESIGENLKSFKCDGTTGHNYARSNRTELVSSHDEILTCYVNEQPIDFLFDDLSQGAGLWARDSGLSKMACAMVGGEYKKKECHGLDKTECAKVDVKLRNIGVKSGTSYNPAVGGCVLNAVLHERTANLIRDVGIGIAITVGTGGAGTIPVLVSVGTDAAFAYVEEWQRRIPYSDYKAFTAALYPCYGMKPVQKKWCFADVLHNNYKLLVGEITDLSPDVQRDLAQKMSEIRETIGEEEYIKKASTSEIDVFKRARGGTQYALMIGMFLVNPEKIATEVDDFARLRKMVGSDESFFKALQDFQRTGRTARFLNSLTPAELDDLNKVLRQQNIMVELERSGDNVLLFKDLTKTGPSPAQTRSLKVGQMANKFDDGTEAFINKFSYAIDLQPQSWQEVLFKWNLPANATDDMIEETYQYMKAEANLIADDGWSTVSDISASIAKDYDIIKRTKPNYLRYGKNTEPFFKRFNYNTNVNPSPSDWKMVLYKWGLPSGTTDDMIDETYKLMKGELYSIPGDTYHNNGIMELRASIDTEYDIIRLHKPNYGKSVARDVSTNPTITPTRVEPATASKQPTKQSGQKITESSETKVSVGTNGADDTQPLSTSSGSNVINTATNLNAKMDEFVHIMERDLQYNITRQIKNNVDDIAEKWGNLWQYYDYNSSYIDVYKMLDAKRAEIDKVFTRYIELDGVIENFGVYRKAFLNEYDTMEEFLLRMINRK